MTLVALQTTAGNTTEGWNREKDEGGIKTNLEHQRKALLKAGRMEMM